MIYLNSLRVRLQLRIQGNTKDVLAVSAVQIMETYSITSLVIVNEDGTVAGILHRMMFC